MSCSGDLTEGAGKAELNRILGRDLFFYFLDLEVKRSRRYQNFFCLLVLKLFQNSPPGESRNLEVCYRQVARLLMEEFRESDVLGCLGQDSWAVLLPYADASAGCQAKRHFEGSLKYYDFMKEGYEIRIDKICFPADGTDTVDLIKRINMTEATP